MWELKHVWVNESPVDGLVTKRVTKTEQAFGLSQTTKGNGWVSGSYWVWLFHFAHNTFEAQSTQNVKIIWYMKKVRSRKMRRNVRHLRLAQQVFGFNPTLETIFFQPNAEKIFFHRVDFPLCYQL